jgi:hypothetical protein
MTLPAKNDGPHRAMRRFLQTCLTLMSAVWLLAACTGVQPGAPRSVATAPATGPTPAAPSPDDVASFNGLSAKDVIAALGTPSYRRHDAPAEIWQYYGQSCVLDLFLYDEHGVQRVAHAEVRGQGGGQSVQGSCLSTLASSRRG